MDDTQTPVRVLSVPQAEPAHFARNFIKQAVCEFRFPTLFELEGQRPPASFANALRKFYPIYEVANAVNLSAGGVARSNAHVFKEKRARWTVTLRAAAITLETSHYDAFSEFEERLTFILSAAEKVIDSEFFTRVGLRYINSVPCAIDDIGDWVNPNLVGLLQSGVYGDVDEYSHRVVGNTATGGYLFQHGLGIDSQTQNTEYVLDFDFFGEDVPLSETIGVVRSLHAEEFAMFSWALGPRSKEYLGPSTT